MPLHVVDAPASLLLLLTFVRRAGRNEHGGFVTSLVVIGAVTSAWSWFERKAQERKQKEMLVDSSVASAKSGVPVVVSVTEVTPAGQPNVGTATLVSSTGTCST